MRLVVLNVAPPFATVGPDAAGGAEQAVTQLDAALVHAGHESIVVAREGSATEGILLSTAIPGGPPSDAARRQVHEQFRFILEKFLEKWPIDLIHLHGIDFPDYLPPPGVPVLVTLHAPAEFYRPEAFRISRPQTYLHAVSAGAFPPSANLLPPMDRIEQYFAVYERLAAEARAHERLRDPDEARLAVA